VIISRKQCMTHELINGTASGGIVGALSCNVTVT